MNKHLPIWAFLALFCTILISIASPLHAQTDSIKSKYFKTIEEEEVYRFQHYLKSNPSNACATQKMPENVIDPRKRGEKDMNGMLRSNLAAWDITAGYGATCANDCVFTAPNTCNGSAVYKVPVQFTVSTSACSIGVPTTAELDAQINIMNDFFACQGIPIRYYIAAPTRQGDFGCTFNNSAVADLPNVINIRLVAMKK
jgi:hypothetical protein